MRRMEYKARGSANILDKRSSNVEVTLDTKKEAVKKSKAPAKAAKK